MLLERLVVGDSIESITYAFLNDCYFLSNQIQPPMFYEELEQKVLGSDRKDYTWARVYLMMALQGKIITSKPPENIRILENQIKISSSGKISKYEFSKCEIFNTTNLDLENKIIKNSPPVYTVYDDFELANLGGKHKYLKSKKTKDKMAREIHYYISDRVDGANYVTDCVVESRLSREELNDFEFSDTMARFSVERHLTSLGVYGNFMEYYKSGKPKFRKPKVVHRKRLVIKKETNKYEDSESVKFLDLDLGEIFDARSTTRS